MGRADAKALRQESTQHVPSMGRRPVGLEYSEQGGKPGREVGEIGSDKVLRWTSSAGVHLDIVL